MNQNYLTIFIFTFFVINFFLNEATPYPGPPVVPKRLEKPEDIQKYLEKLKQYYLVAGRPRYVNQNVQFNF
jgi:hypothetical protein